MPKLRVDLLLVERGLAESREQAQRLVSAGRVTSGTTTFVKASQMVSDNAELVVSEPERYVSRGGHKLEAALREFGVDPSGRVCLDLGASTGGFTDCLLQHGAAGVIAVDVGRAQLHQKLREDARVVLMEGVNARALPELSIDDFRMTVGDEGSGEGKGARDTGVGVGRLSIDDFRLTIGQEGSVAGKGVRDSDDGIAVVEEARVEGPNQRPSTIVDRKSTISLFVADLAFISLRKVLPSVAGRLAAGTEGVVLLKPQFEAGRKDVPRGGVIKDEAVVERVRAEFVSWCEGEGWAVYGMIRSPIRGGDGNVEMLIHVRTPEAPQRRGDTEKE